MNATPDPGVLARVNALAAKRGLQGAEELGRYLLDTFFGGSPARFRGEGKGNDTFRTLVQSPGLQASYSLLYYSIAVTEQLDQLPAEVGSALTFSHHKLLLPLKDPRTKERLARRAIAEDLSVRGLREVVSQHQERQKLARRGRPPLPDFVKALHRLPKLVGEIRAAELESDRLFDRYSPDQAQLLLKRTRRNITRLEKLVARLQERVDDAIG